MHPFCWRGWKSVRHLAKFNFTKLGGTALGLRNLGFDDSHLIVIVELNGWTWRGTCDSERLWNGSERPICCRAADSGATTRRAGLATRTHTSQ
jgi:hypothetical protein